jgi:CubicO group peptidase (beta-lactamase class C family)
VETAQASFQAARAVIEEGRAARAFPAAVVNVGNAAGVLWHEAFGTLTYEDGAPPCRVDTIFDLASLTKVIATGSIAMRQVRAGTVMLNTPVSAVVPDWKTETHPTLTVRHLLDHSSGLPAHLRLWEKGAGKDLFRHLICNTPLERAPGTASMYSDPGFMLLGFLLEMAAGQTLQQQLNEILGDWPAPLLYRLPVELRDRTAPTEQDSWRGRLLRGEVHDENASALGGVAGHAGLFGTAEGVALFARLVLRTFRTETQLGTPDQMKLFATKTGVPSSSRALAWDTALPTSSSGAHMSPRAIGHTGFTGTSLWIDPERDLYAVLLTNRVHPTRQNEKLLPLRARFHDALPV